MDSAALAIRLLSPNLGTSLSVFRSTTNHKPTTPSVVRIKCLQTPSPGPTSPPGPVHGSTFSCSAVAQEAPPKVSSAPDAPRVRLVRLADEFRSLPEPVDRVKRLLRYGGDIPPFPEAERTPSNRVMGCTAQVWLAASVDTLGRMRFVADSDSEITKGFCSCLIWVLDGAKPEEVLEVCPDDFADLNVVGLPGRTSSRVNTWHNVLISMQKRTRTLLAEMDGKPPVERFPSLVIGPDGIQAKGSYAEAQVRRLGSLSWVWPSSFVNSLKETRGND